MMSSQPLLPDLQRMLRVRAIELRLRLTGDGYVDEAGAALLLGVSPRTLRRWREEARPIPYRRMCGRPQYSLDALGEFLHALPSGDLDP
ncbi:MAG TPA: hypothetical protein VGC79_08315 [Polyangiaceae bacterium]